MRLLITGICGFVGSELAKAIRQSTDAIEIEGIDNFSRPGSWLNREPLIALGIKVIHGDIRVPSDLEGLARFDWIIDCAANPSVLAGIDGKSSSRQLIENNLVSTINLLEACKRWNAGFILLSTSRVYSIPPLAGLDVEVVDRSFSPSFPAADHSTTPGIGALGINENFSTAPPVSLYGTSKLTSEQLSLEYGLTFDFPVWVNRCGVMAGARQFGKPDQGIFAFWLHSWREKRPLKYIGFDGMGHQVRDCLHPRDVASLVLKQMEVGTSAAPRVVNLSGGLTSSRSLRQLSDWCADRWGPAPVASDPVPRSFDLPWVVLDHTLATQTWDWQPTTTVETVMQEIAEFADANPDWISVSA
jgi:CDP-paratose 2-epimerase